MSIPTLDKLNYLSTDAKAAFDAGMVIPETDVFFDRNDRGLCCCGLSAAYVRVVGAGEVRREGHQWVPRTGEVVGWATSRYDLSESAVEGFVAGFDSVPRGDLDLSEYEDRQDFLMGYSAGRDLSREVFPRRPGNQS